MSERRDWTRNETLMALALYLLLPANQRIVTNPDIVTLSKRISRTPSAVKLKIFNLASCDPMYVGKAMRNRSGLDTRIWQEYERRGDELTEEAVHLLLEGGEFEVTRQLTPTEESREAEVAVHATLRYFHNLLMRNYDGRCCLTGLRESELLVACPIKPWDATDSVRDRLSPENGLLLNTLHGRAFEKGLITLDENLCVVVSGKVGRDAAMMKLVWSYEGEKISVPGHFHPRKDFIEYHNDAVFRH